MNNTHALTTKHRKIRRNVGFTVSNVGDGFDLKVGDKIMFENLKELNKTINTKGTEND